MDQCLSVRIKQIKNLFLSGCLLAYSFSSRTSTSEAKDLEDIVENCCHF